ncbi:MAG: helix-turn-helix domain-containing protein [Gemmatimonadetes bacterium]|nr:helix-turn-helix domain-containing protein [Gemmatimonadota bacterium]
MAKRRRPTVAEPTVGDIVIEGLKQMVALEQGKPYGEYRIHAVALTAADSKIAEAPEYSYQRIAKLRARMKLSQPLFAQALNVSPETVRAWEQGKRHPDGAALRLLQVTEQQPELLLSMVKERTVRPYKARKTKR